MLMQIKFKMVHTGVAAFRYDFLTKRGLLGGAELEADGLWGGCAGGDDARAGTRRGLSKRFQTLVGILAAASSQRGGAAHRSGNGDAARRVSTVAPSTGWQSARQYDEIVWSSIDRFVGNVPETEWRHEKTASPGLRGAGACSCAFALQPGPQVGAAAADGQYGG